MWVMGARPKARESFQTELLGVFLERRADLCSLLVGSPAFGQARFSREGHLLLGEEAATLYASAVVASAGRSSPLHRLGRAALAG